MTTITVVYDVKLKRPGCVLLQAMACASIDSWNLELLGDWLVAPTPDMKLLHVTPAQLKKLQAYAHTHRRGA